MSLPESSAPQRAGPQTGPWRPWVTISATIGIVAVLMIPGPSVPSVGFSGIDVLAHILLFAAWAAAVQWEFAFRFGRLMALAAGFALATESLQTLAIERTFSMSDIAADLAGAALGGLLTRWLRRRSLQFGE